MSSTAITYYDLVTLRPLNLLGALHDPDMTIQVVPRHEADAVQGRISVDAPLGRAILRKRCGDAVTIQIQDQSISMLILAVERPGSTHDDQVAMAVAA
jgi:hypothetical protein